MFADIRKKFCAALVGSLMFFGAPNCSAGGAGVAMITSGIVSILGGGLLTANAVIEEIVGNAAIAALRKPGVPLWVKIWAHTAMFAPGAVGLGAGAGLIAAGTQH